MPGRSGRKGYPARSTFDGIFERWGLKGELVTCTRAATVDGERLTGLVNTQRTPRPFEIRPEAKFAEAFSGVVAACWVGLRDVAVSTVFPDGRPREAPDLLLRAANYPPIDVEIVRVDETAAIRIRLFEIQERIADLMAQQPTLKTSRQVRFTIDFEKAKAFDAPAFTILGDELLNFWRRGTWRTLPRGRHASVFDRNTAAARCGLIVEVDHSTYAALLSFEQADEMTPFESILNAISSKRKIKYVYEHDLWLVVEVADPRFPFTKALNEIARRPIEISPFSRVVVYDGHGVHCYRRFDSVN